MRIQFPLFLQYSVDLNSTANPSEAQSRVLPSKDEVHFTGTGKAFSKRTQKAIIRSGRTLQNEFRRVRKEKNALIRQEFDLQRANPEFIAAGIRQKAARLKTLRQLIENPERITSPRIRIARQIDALNEKLETLPQDEFKKRLKIEKQKLAKKRQYKAYCELARKAKKIRYYLDERHGFFLQEQIYKGVNPYTQFKNPGSLPIVVYALEQAAQEGRIQDIEKLIQIANQTPLKSQEFDKSKNLLFMRGIGAAVRSNKIESLRAFLDAEKFQNAQFDTEHKNPFGISIALLSATICNYTDIIKALGADERAKQLNNIEATLSFATRQGNIEALQAFYESRYFPISLQNMENTYRDTSEPQIQAYLEREYQRRKSE
jgi:hypothetical protein